MAASDLTASCPPQRYSTNGCVADCRCDTVLIVARQLAAIGEIVHDVDLKDTKFGRDETTGIAHLISGLCAAHDQDERRLARGGAVLDDFYEGSYWVPGW